MPVPGFRSTQFRSPAVSNFMFASSPVIIRRLRLRTAGGDPITSRLRIGGSLERLPWQSTGLGPAAILCIRTLRDPLPGRLSLSSPHARRTETWESAFSLSLQNAAGEAARPAGGAVPPTASAVVFTDRAELLACLTRDWLTGRVGDGWWWAGLFGTGYPDVGSLLVAEPTSLPSVIQFLATQGLAGDFARRLDDDLARRLSKALVEVNGLSAIARILAEVIFERPHAVALTKFHTNSAVPEARSRHSKSDFRGVAGYAATSETVQVAALPRSAPWEQNAPEISLAGLGTIQQIVLAIPLMLHRTPMTVRSAEFARELADWMWSRESLVPSGIGPTHELRRVTTSSPTARLAGARDCAHNQSGDQNSIDDAPGSEITDERAGDAQKPQTSQAPSAPASTSSTDAVVSTIASGLPQPETGSRAVDRPGAFETELGGLFYLLNLALSLELYGDFTTPGQPGLALSPWDFVTLVGREFIGLGREKDPIWSLLAQLAGRDAMRSPGWGFQPSGEWRMPFDWLRPWSEQSEWRWECHDDRLRVFVDDRFRILDVARNGDPTSQLASELQPYVGIIAAVQEVIRPSEIFASEPFEAMQADADGVTQHRPAPDPALRRWLNWLLPYLRVRIARALGIDDGFHAATLLCCARGRVFTTPTCVDVVLSLADLPIEIRCAGLDRDPGWIPAAGRTVSFRFE